MSLDLSQDPQYKTTDGSALRIWRDALKNNFLSEREGVPIFDDCILIEVYSPGSRDSSPVFEVERVFDDRMQHAPLRGMKYDEYKQYIESFKNDEKNDGSLTGTPLSQWPEMDRRMVASLRAQNIFTVDALSQLPDTSLSIIGPDGRTWREKAKAYLESGKDSSYATALAADLEAEKVKSAALADQVSTLAGQIQTMQAQMAAQGGAPAPSLAAEEPKPGKGGKAAGGAPDPLAVDPLAPAPPVI